MKKLSVVVEGVRKEAEDIKSFVLAPLPGSKLSPFTAGAHVDVYIAPNIVRQYSLCGDIRNMSRYMIAVKREPKSRGGSCYMHDRIKVGDQLEISEPRNNFHLDETAPHSILLAGGIGITPIVAMAERLAMVGHSFELHYFTRSPLHSAFHGRLSDACFGSRVHFHHALGPAEVEACLHKLLHIYKEDNQVYLCGPKLFMDTVEAVAADNWPSEAVHMEYFAADPSIISGPRLGFEVRLARRGGTYHIPEDQSIVEVLRDHGIDIDYSCEQGVCGTCLTGVLDGEPDHRDMFIGAAEKAANDRICLCVSRSKSPLLVLDL